MSRSRSTIATMGILATVLGLSIVASLFPDNLYLRFQLLKHTEQAEAQWIYERIHFDNRPIDVLILGPSTTKLGLSSTRMKERLTERDLSVEVVNFSVTFGGRDLIYAIVREMFRAGRRPKLLVIGITERPSHFGHPAFKYLADPSDVLDSLYLVNLNYFSNLQYLPFRQMKLAAMSAFPTSFGTSPRFDPDLYYTYRDFDLARSPRLFDGTPFDRERKVPRATLLKAAASYEGGAAKPILPSVLADLEFGDETFYIPKIVKLANDYGTKVGFVYIPRFRGPPKSLYEAFYAHYGPVFDASFITDSNQLFFEMPHLNRNGALVVTDWLTDRIACLLVN